MATLSVLAFLGIALVAAQAAGPLSSATVTRVENKVKYGETRGQQSVTRPASVGDTVKESNFVQTDADSRAELQFVGGELVRVGQDSVFSFEASSRTFSARKGTFVFYVPQGQGGRIQSASITAAISGTLGKVSPTMIAIISGEVTLIPSGRKVGAGQFAQVGADGEIVIRRFNPAAAGEGALMAFNGPMPGFNENQLLPGRRLALAMPDIRNLDVLERTQNLPAAIIQRRGVFVPPPPSDGGNTPPY